MKRPGFPFAALVGLSDPKLALTLAAVDWRLSVLLRGDKGTGKTTAARGITELLPEGSPFVNLPLGATEDRLLGGLDLGRTMKGDPVLKPGLLVQSHGGVVYIDEVNLLPDHLADSLLDVAAGGVMFLEREGFSDSRECRFLLLGSMNPEERELRPQLLDRFALVVDVQPPQDSEDRRRAVEHRMRFEANPRAFLEEWADEQEHLRTMVFRARENVAKVVCPPELLSWISRIVSEHNVRSLRADLAIVRASIAKAALDGSQVVRQEHIEAVLPLVLSHRSKRTSPPPPPAPPSTTPRDPEKQQHEAEKAAGERVFAPRAVEAPRLVATHLATPRQSGTNAAPSGRSAPVVSLRRTPEPAEFDPRASVARALVETGQPIPRAEDLHERIREGKTATRYIFVVDSSGSHGVKDRMRLVKGAVAGLFAASADCRDEVAVVAFRGTAAEVVAEPTRDFETVRQALEYLPTGGRTPLSNGLEVALRYVTPASILVLLTDGRANVPSKSEDAWADALDAARQVRCPALVIDTEESIGATGRPALLAEAMNARHTKLESLASGQDLILK